MNLRLAKLIQVLQELDHVRPTATGKG
uniref:Uncharacterized protein n=1 Tax=Rhizophora mucronata TaxID=61149 RepID=A0A2P2Q3P0_RHIMU